MGRKTMRDRARVADDDTCEGARTGEGGEKWGRRGARAHRVAGASTFRRWRWRKRPLLLEVMRRRRRTLVARSGLGRMNPLPSRGPTWPTDARRSGFGTGVRERVSERRLGVFGFISAVRGLEGGFDGCLNV